MHQKNNALLILPAFYSKMYRENLMKIYLLQLY